MTASNPADLEFVNLIAAMAWPHPPFPAPLADAGFALWGVDQEVPTSIAAVRPDIGLSHAAENHTLLFECKSGGIDGNQAQRYRAIDGSSYGPAGFVMSNRATHTHQVAYAVSLRNSRRRGRFVPQKPFPAISLDTDDKWVIAKFRGTFTSAAAERVFAKPQRLPAEVPQIIWFHPHSSEIAVMRRVMTVFVRGALEGRDGWSFSQLVSDCLEHEPGIAAIYPGIVRNRLLNVIRLELPDAVDNELARFLTIGGGQVDGIQLRPHRRDNVGWARRLGAAASEYLSRLQAGQPATSQIPLPFSIPVELASDSDGEWEESDDQDVDEEAG